jgi:aryl-alcohol dehydrogenase-like predicted oxidoreductase
MQYVNLGTTGLKVSRICLGMMTYGTPAWRDWILDEDASRPFIARALELGINFFDTADVYSLGVSEEVTGRALNALTKRDEVVIATKVHGSMSSDVNDRGLSRKHIMAGIDNSLRRLGTDYVDLYQTHRWDYDTPIEETMEVLHDVVKVGKARYIGASSMYAWQFAKAQHTAEKNGWTRFVTMQNHYNLVYREEEREMMPLCEAEGIGVIPWSPLARGFLAGDRTPETPEPTARSKTDEYGKMLYYTEDDFEVAAATRAVAEARGVKPAQVALAWVLQAPGVTAPIIGTTKIDHITEAVAALGIKLEDDEVKALESPYRPHRVLGHIPPVAGKTD